MRAKVPTYMGSTWAVFGVVDRATSPMSQLSPTDNFKDLTRFLFFWSFRLCCIWEELSISISNTRSGSFFQEKYLVLLALGRHRIAMALIKRKNKNSEKVS